MLMSWQDDLHRSATTNKYTSDETSASHIEIWHRGYVVHLLWLWTQVLRLQPDLSYT